MKDENNVLWRPTYDGMTLEQKVDKASIVQKLGEDESKVVSQKCVKSAFDVFNFTPDCAVNQRGVIVEDNRYCITRKIDVSNLVGKSIIWACGSDKQDLSLASLAEYDSSDAFVGNYGMNSTRTVTVDGKKVELTPKEYDPLFYLVENKKINNYCKQLIDLRMKLKS